MYSRILLVFSRSQAVLKHVLALALLAAVAAAQQERPADLTAAIDRIARQEMQKQQIPAMTIAVVLDGHIVYSKGFGIADKENGVAANQDTLIRTGSLAKPLTAVAAMTLVEAGKLDLDAPIQKYCPAFPQKEWRITTRELLTHTSGIRHYRGDEVDSTKHYKNMSDGFAIFAADPLLFQPGAKFSYSTYGYTVVGCVIEGASGEKFYNYLREHVLVPANMTHTFVDDQYTIVPHRARGYRTQNGELQNAGPMDSSYKIPGGGLVSTAEDFVRFGLALMGGKIVKPETLATLWTATGVPDLSDGKPSTYGLGFGVLMIDGQQYIAHDGGQQGTSTDMAFIPAKRFAVAVFTNNESAEPFEVLRPILELYQMPGPQPNK
ncbi:MAG: serine hydrolase domain-containing protein [Candidatus Sulfotelmatobacter sp.]